MQGQLYRKSYDDIHLRCLKKEEAERVMEEFHQRVCGPHMNGRMLANEILRVRYYLNMMEIGCVDFVMSCHNCPTHANLKHMPPCMLYSTMSPKPFLVKGIDLIGRIAPKALNGHENILVAIDYFTKLVEAVSYSVLKAKHVTRFIENNIICRF